MYALHHVSYSLHRVSSHITHDVRSIPSFDCSVFCQANVIEPSFTSSRPSFPNLNRVIKLVVNKGVRDGKSRGSPLAILVSRLIGVYFFFFFVLVKTNWELR